LSQARLRVISKSIANVHTTNHLCVLGYRDRPLAVEGSLAALDTRVSAISTTISAASVTGDDVYVATFPASLVSLTVAGASASSSSLPSRFQILGVPASRSLTVLGGGSNDEFILPDISLLLGLTSLIGGGGSNTANFTLRAFPGVPGDVTVSPQVLVAALSPGDNPVVVRHSDLTTRNYFLHAAAHTRTRFNVLDITDVANVRVYATGAGAGSVVEQVVAGCDGQSFVEVYLAGGGDHIVTLGAMGSLADLDCVVRVYGDVGDQTNTVVIQGGNETRALRFEVSGDNTGGRVVVSDLLSSAYNFQINFQGLQRLQLELPTQNSQVQLVSTPVGCEIALRFPDPASTELGPTPGSGFTPVLLNTVDIAAVDSPVLVTNCRLATGCQVCAVCL
jgi:hypothetical protein